MARNIEVKARISDPAAVRSRAASLASGPAQVLDQTDVFFAVHRGRLKVREFADGSGELISYERTNHPGPRESVYAKVACADAKALSETLGAVLPLRGTVVKRREVLLAGRTRIHLDEVRSLGDFVELEVVLGEEDRAEDGVREAHELLRALGISDAALVSGAYLDLLEEAGVQHDVDVKPSPIEGLGIFAARPFRAEERIRRVNVVREITAASPLREDLGERREHCAYPDGKVVLIGPPDRYVNHSCDPNAYEAFEGDSSYIVARRPIRAGDEVTIDYNVNISGGTAWPCACGASRCRGRVAGEFFELPSEWQREYRPLLAPWFVNRHREQIEALDREHALEMSPTAGTPQKVSLAEKLALFADLWSPRAVGAVNDCLIKLVKLKGEFVWHAHETEDELFLVIRGRLRMQFREREVTVAPGELIIVPHGTEHRPLADEEVHVLLVEPKTTLNTGTAGGERTRDVEWI